MGVRPPRHLNVNTAAGYIISPTTAAGLQTSLLLFLLRTAARQEALGDRARSSTSTFLLTIALRWPDSPFRPKPTSHVCRPTLAAASSLQSLFAAVQASRCIFHHVFAFPHFQDASCERDQLRSGHRG